VERAAWKPLRTEWTAIDEVIGPVTLAKALGRLNRDGIDAVFKLGSGPGPERGADTVGYLDVGAFGMDTADYVDDGPRAAVIREAYPDHVVRMLVFAGKKPAAARREALSILMIELALARAATSGSVPPGPLGSLLAQHATHFPSADYLAAAGVSAGAQFISLEKYLARVDELVAEVPMDYWRAFLRWQVLLRMVRAGAAPASAVKERAAFEGKYVSGAPAQRKRGELCLSSAFNALGDVMARIFVAEHVPGEAGAVVQRIVTDVRKAQVDRLSSVAWLDAATRQKALEKAAAIRVVVGQPERWRSYAGMKVVRGSWAASLKGGAAFSLQENLMRIGQPASITGGPGTTVVPTGLYMPRTNSIFVPAAFLLPPIFRRGAAEAANYGSLGWSVGHELTHAFDGTGRRYDARGARADWWSPTTDDEFRRRAACFVEQYSDYEAIDEVRVDGRRTLGENLADAGAFRLALAAYRASRAGRPAEPAVLGLSPEQQLLVAGAQVFCSRERPEATRRAASTSPHSPDRWRVNGALSNLPEFAAVFQCKAGDRMVRPKPCEIW
jgi:endothelin-converting enzyme/putative endopeptidase